MEINWIAYTAIGLFAFILVRSILRAALWKNSVRQELHHIVNNPDHKVKGRFDE